MGDNAGGARSFTVLCDSAAVCASISHQKGAMDYTSRGAQFLKEDPHRLGQPLEIETKNKAGMIVQKIRTSIRGSLLL